MAHVGKPLATRVGSHRVRPIDRTEHSDVLTATDHRAGKHSHVN